MKYKDILEGFPCPHGMPLTMQSYAQASAGVSRAVALALLRQLSGHDGQLGMQRYWVVDVSLQKYAFDGRDQCAYDLDSGQWWIRRRSAPGSDCGEWHGYGIPTFLAALTGLDSVTFEQDLKKRLKVALNGPELVGIDHD